MTQQERDLVIDELVAHAANRGACLTWGEVVCARRREALVRLSDAELQHELLLCRRFYTRPSPRFTSASS